MSEITKKSDEQKGAEAEVESFRKDLGPFVVAAETTRMAMVFTDAKEPNIPTMRESAPELASFDLSSWFGVFLPKTAPEPVVTALNNEIKTLLARDDIKKNIAAMGATGDYGTPAQYQAFVEAETAKVKTIIDKEGLQMEVK